MNDNNNWNADKKISFMYGGDPGGFKPISGFDKIVNTFDKIIIPLLDKGVKISDTVARHRGLSIEQQKNDMLHSTISQQQEQIQCLTQLLFQQPVQHPPQSPQFIQTTQVAQLPQFIESQSIIDTEQVITVSTEPSNASPESFYVTLDDKGNEVVSRYKTKK